jgi:hypothetical protein
MKQIETNLKQKIPYKFFCKSCLHGCNNKKDFTRHLSTTKHKCETFETKMEQQIPKTADYGADLASGDKMDPKNPLSFLCSKCNNTYNSRTSLWRHKKDCCKFDVSITDKSESNHEMVSINNSNIDIKELIMLLVKENKDVQLQMQQNFLDLIPKIQSMINSYNNTNSNNTNNFNIQMFLNDHCKHAMNLTDFIDTLPITSETYDHTIENGLTKTITNMVVNGLNNMNILERPIHCTDPSRRIVYVKDNDIWERDNELVHLLRGIKKLSLKQRTSLNKWQDANHGWDRDENLQTRMTKLVFNSMTNIEEDEKETNKIIRAISKNTYLSSDIKHEYK